MQNKLEILEALKQNIIDTRESDYTTNELNEELTRIESDIDEAIQKTKEEELEERLNKAFQNDQSHTKRLSEN